MAAGSGRGAVPLDAVILLIGDELLTGRLRDANGQWIAHRLAALGHTTRRIVVVPDRVPEIVEELSRATTLAQWVFVSGGLGPTHDDLTTEAVARFLGVPTVVDAEGREDLARKYRERYQKGLRPDAELTEASLKQVTIPKGALPLPNPVGAAIGYVAKAPPGAQVVVMPGVPAEMQSIFATHVETLLPPGRPHALVLEVDVALPESLFSRQLDAIAREYAELSIGSYPHFGEKRVTLRFRGEDADRVRAAAGKAVDAFRAHVIAERDVTNFTPG